MEKFIKTVVDFAKKNQKNIFVAGLILLGVALATKWFAEEDEQD
jgi:hypothetical protein